MVEDKALDDVEILPNILNLIDQVDDPVEKIRLLQSAVTTLVFEVLELRKTVAGLK